MADSTWDIQTAVYSRLAVDSALTSLLAAGSAGVLDHVPGNTAFPYVVLGETRAQPVDTAQGDGYEVVITLHSYSRAAGMAELRQIMSALHASLHRAAFTVPNHALILCRLLDSETRMEVDGKTRHGTQRFQLITEPA